MTFVGVLCFVFGLALSFGIALALRSVACVLLFLYHAAASVLYWLYSLREGADAVGYYAAQYDPSTEISPGTHFITWLTVRLREFLGASYFDLFMLYHIAGYIGVVLIFQLCRRMLTTDEDEPAPYIVYLAIFLPGLHVWTSAIGKDSLVFLGIACFLWGAAKQGAGLLHMLLGLAICALIRPHIAALLASSCALSLALSGGVPLHWRIAVVGLLSGGLWWGMPYLQEFLRVDEFNPTSMIGYMEQRQARNLDGGSSLSISERSLPFQYFTFMYRPLFFDANGVLGLVVSVENLFYLGLSIFCLPRVIGPLIKGEDAFFLRFNVLYFGLGALILASTTSNLGLAIRQKMMVVPSLILISMYAYARNRNAEWSMADEDHQLSAT
jgi:hypothetical protein